MALLWMSSATSATVSQMTVPRQQWNVWMEKSGLLTYLTAQVNNTVIEHVKEKKKQTQNKDDDVDDEHDIRLQK